MKTEHNILAWLDGSLDDNAKAEFEAHLLADPDFKKEVEDAELLWKDLRVYARHEQIRQETIPLLAQAKRNVAARQAAVAQQDQSQSEELAAPPSSKPRPLWKNPRLLSMAAAILMLMAAGPFIWDALQPPVSGPELYAEYFENDNSGTMGGADPGIEQMIQRADNDYIDKKFAKAEAAYREIVLDTIGSESQKNKARFRLAKSFMQQSKFVQAREQLSQLYASIEYGPHSRWNTVLSFLAEDRVAEAKTTLQKMDAAQDVYKGPKRKEILKKVR